MLDRNKDTLFNDLIDICASSQSEILRSLFPEATSKKNKKRPTTAAFKIKSSINELVKALAQCSAHYIRCMKPNDNKRANDFNDKRCLHQIQYLGLQENIRVRRAGFAYRHLYRPFFYRYRILCDQTYPTWQGSEKDACVKICESMGMRSGDDFQLGTSKIFVRKPESVFALEEKREHLTESFASRIQRFLQKFALQTYYYELQVNGNRTLEGHKERRRFSVEVRKFAGDYINFRENFELKKLLPNKNEKVHFADMGTKYDRRSKPHRRILLISNVAYYEISLEPNKEQGAAKPFHYVLKRRIEYNSIKGVVLSTLQDGFMLWQLPDYDTVIDCKRKTEMLALAKTFCPNLQVSFSNSWNVIIKGNKKGPALKFASDSSAPATGAIKGRDVKVAPGQPMSSQCKVEAPLEMPKVDQPRRAMPQMAKPTPQRSAVSPRAPQHNTAVSPRPKYGGGAAVPAAKAVSPRPKYGGPVKAKAAPPKKAVHTFPPKKGPSKVGKAPKKNFKAAKSPRKVPPGPKAKMAKGGPRKMPAKVPGGRGKCKAIWDFEALNPDELSLKAGDVISLINDSSDDWWKGELRGKVGIFPRSYVQKT